MISPLQALLARTMLRLSQKEAAAQLGVAHATLSNIENGQSDPPASRLRELEAFYESQGIEFLEGDGVRQRQLSVRRYRGRDELRLFMDDVYDTAKKTGGEICLFNGVPVRLRAALGEDWYKMHAARMQSIKDQFDFKVTVRAGENQFIGSSFAAYRHFPEKLFNERTIYVYGGKVAFLTFDDDDARVLVMNQQDIADSFRVLFNIAWDNVATPIETGTAS